MNYLEVLRMKSDMKIKRALIDTPGMVEYPKGTYEYTPEVLELMAQDLRNQVVELDFHDGIEIGNVVKIGHCPTHGLWADLAVPVDTPEDDVKFSTDVTVLETEMTDEGVKRLLNARLDKVVWATNNGAPVRKTETRLCNAELEDNKMAEEDKIKIGELQVKIGQLETELAQKEQTISALETDKGTIETELNALKETNTEYEGELKIRRGREDKFKETLLDEIVGEDGTLKEAYKTWSIPQLKALKAKEVDNVVEDTTPKGAKVKSTKKPVKATPDDKKPTYEDMQKARDSGVL